MFLFLCYCLAVPPSARCGKNVDVNLVLVKLWLNSKQNNRVYDCFYNWAPLFWSGKIRYTLLSWWHVILSSCFGAFGLASWWHVLFFRYKTVLLWCLRIDPCRKQLLLKTSCDMGKQPYVELRAEHMGSHVVRLCLFLFSSGITGRILWSTSVLALGVCFYLVYGWIWSVKVVKGLLLHLSHYLVQKVQSLCYWHPRFDVCMNSKSRNFVETPNLACGTLVCWLGLDVTKLLGCFCSQCLVCFERQ